MSDADPVLPTGLVLRDGRDGDGPGLGALIAGVFAEYEGCPFVDAEFPELAAPARHYGNRGGRLWVIEDGSGRLVGSLAATPGLRVAEVELFKVYVARPWRGRGLARALFRKALGFAAGRGATRMVLWSDTRFLDGHRFYLRQGFRQMPGLRALHDAGCTLEYGFGRAVAAPAQNRRASAPPHS